MNGYDLLDDPCPWKSRARAQCSLPQGETSTNGGASLNNSESQIQWIYHHDQDMTHAKINSKKPLDLKSNVGPARTELKIDPLYAEGENVYMKGGWHNHIRVQK